MKRSRPNQRNAKRRAALHARNFGEEAKRVRAMPCLGLVRIGEWRWEGREIGEEWCLCDGAIAAAHVTARGMGGVKSGRFDIVPLCAHHHREAGEAGTSQRATFEQCYGLDLRAEADRIALEHARPLGIRGLAARWSVWEEGASALGMTTCFRLDAYETEALLGSVRRRMDREVERRTSVREAARAKGRAMWEGQRDWSKPWDGLPDNDREALAHAVAIDLGGVFADDPHGEHGLAWTLCDRAGWPA